MERGELGHSTIIATTPMDIPVGPERMAQGVARW